MRNAATKIHHTFNKFTEFEMQNNFRSNRNSQRLVEVDIATLNQGIVKIGNARLTIMESLGQEKGRELLGDRVRYDWEYARMTEQDIDMVSLAPMINYGSYGDGYVVGHGFAHLTLMGFQTTDLTKQAEVIVVPDQKPRTGRFGQLNVADNKAFRQALLDEGAMDNPATVQPKLVIPCTHSFYKDGEEKEVRMIYIIASKVGSVAAHLNRAPRTASSPAPVEEMPLHQEEDELETALATS
jgi:hypothetical protein